MSTATVTSLQPPEILRTRPPWPGIAAIAAAAFAVEMAVSARYGYARDELYFLAAGHHLALGYVDQPSLTPLLARVESAVFGNALAGLRVLPALGLAALVVATAVMSRQLFAALAAATCAEFLGVMHELTTAAPDFVFWAVTLVLVMRLLASEDPRWWVAIGGCVGIASEAKWNIGFLVAALAAGFAATGFADRGARRLLRSRYLLLGVVIAAALAAPDLVWQATHGWPELDVFRALDGAAGHNRAVFWLGQFLYAGPVLTGVWVTGAIWSLRSAQARRFRPVAIACVAAIVLQFVLGGKSYYPGAAYTFLLAAGSVPLERRLAARRLVKPTVRVITPVTRTAAAMLAGAVLAAPVALSVLPARVLHTVPLQKINYDLAETIAWPKEVALVAREYDSLPASQRAQTAILTGNYGEAGAIDRYGSGLALPQAYSGANNFWLWGPPPAGDRSVIAVNVDPALLRREFARVRLVATFRNGLGVSDDEQGAQVFIATGLRSSWAQAWPAFRNYS